LIGIGIDYKLSGCLYDCQFVFRIAQVDLNSLVN